MNIRWLHSQRILLGSLVAAMLAVGVLTSLVIRQQGQADGQIYLETGGTVSAKSVVPLIGRPTIVGGNVSSADAPIQVTAGTEGRADDKGGSQVRCACSSPPPSTMIQPKVQPIHRSTPKPSFRSQRIVVSHWVQPSQPHEDGPLHQPKSPGAGPPPDEVERPEKVGPSDESDEVVRQEKMGPSGDAERPDKIGPSGAPTPRMGR
jgi:hypothetical protein